MPLNQEITKDVKFIHLRQHNDGRQHHRDANARGGVTIGFKEVPVEGDKVKVLYTYAKCHANDNFNKRVGREKCCYRLTGQKDVRIMSLPIGLPREDVRSILIEAYYEEHRHFNPNIRREVF